MTPRRRSAGRATVLALAMSVLAATSPSPAGAAELPVAGGLEDAALEAAVSTPLAEADASLDADQPTAGASVTAPALEATVPTPVGPVEARLPEARVEVAVGGKDTRRATRQRPRDTSGAAPHDAERRRAERPARAAAGTLPTPSGAQGPHEGAPADQGPSRPAAAGAAGSRLAPGLPSRAPGSGSSSASSASAPHGPSFLSSSTLVALALAAAFLGALRPGLVPPLRSSPHDLFLEHPD